MFNPMPFFFSMKNKTGDDWFPMWSDKWIFGSTRIELDPAERGVWVDLMALGNKDDGYIRANETTPYLKQQVAGLLNIPVELLEATIAKCITHGKLKEDPPGIYYIISRQTYELSKRHKRRLELDKNRIEKNKSKRVSSRTDTVSGKTDIDLKFAEIWAKYPNKDGKEAANRHFSKSVKTDKDWDDIKKALTNYTATDRVRSGYIKNGSTWFNNWKDWIDYKEQRPASAVPQTRVIDCCLCSGAGKVTRGSKTETCPQCNGAGKGKSTR